LQEKPGIILRFDLYDPLFVTSEHVGLKTITELADIVLNELKNELL